MAKRNYTAEQIISKLREVEVKISQGIRAAEAIRSISVSEQTYSLAKRIWWYANRSGEKNEGS